MMSIRLEIEVNIIAANAVPIEVCIKIDWSIDGAKR